MRSIRKAAVLGSGIMGSGIAAHLANCGVPCLMLDRVPPNLAETERNNPDKRNSLASAGKTALLKAKPAPLYRKADVELIEVGNFEDDLGRIAECDWIIEAVREDLEIKRAILREAARHRRPDAIVSTNTSGVPLRQLAEGMDEDMRRHFLGTHFFNPPRYLKLVEIIPGPETLVGVVRDMAAFAENVLGKGVVYAKDTPNFIANRILTFYCQYILTEFTRDGLTVEEVDALTGPAVGHAASATFRTLDLVGLDTYVQVLDNVYRNCPDDEQHEIFRPPPWMQRMMQNGWLGEKTGMGFYKRTGERDEHGRSVIWSLNVNTLEFAPQQKRPFECLARAQEAASLEEKVRLMHSGDDAGSRFAWKVFAHTAAYAGRRIPEIADDIVSIDNALKWGFAWAAGIFETWDILGVRYVCERMEAEGIEPPPIARVLLESGTDSFYRVEEGRPLYFDLVSKSYQGVPQNPKVLRLAQLKQSRAAVAENASCSLVDLGDRILCAEFHSKMNTIDRDVLAMMRQGVDCVNEGRFDGLVIGNQGEHFSAGANLMWILGEILQENWRGLENAVRAFQQLNMALRFCRGPVVAAPHHYAFGGAIEMSQHAARVVIAAETYGGLVEAGVGVIPGGGGTKEMLRRALAYVPDTVPEPDPFSYVRRAFESIGMAKVSTSGPELIDLGYLDESDVVCVNLDQQLRQAKNVCLGMVIAEYAPPRPARLYALGEPAAAVFRSAVYQYRLGGYATEHDALIAEHLAWVLTGGDRTPGTPMSEQDVLDLECEAFCALCRTEKTKARMQHMLQTGKPLRN